MDLDTVTTRCSLAICDARVGSLALLDANVRGLPVRYVNQDFENMFGFSKDESVGQTFGGLVGGHAVLRSGDQDATAGGLAEAASGAWLTLEEARQGVVLLNDHLANEEERLLHRDAPRWDVGPEQTGAAASRSCLLALLLAKRKGGGIFVCEMVSIPRQHAVLGWKYCVSFFRDVTSSVSVESLLAAVVDGTYCSLLEQQSAVFEKRISDVFQGGIGNYVDETASSMWQDFINHQYGSNSEKQSGKQSGTQCGKQRMADQVSLASMSTTASGMSVASSVATKVPDVGHARIAAAGPTTDEVGTRPEKATEYHAAIAQYVPSTRLQIVRELLREAEGDQEQRLKFGEEDSSWSEEGKWAGEKDSRNKQFFDLLEDVEDVEDVESTDSSMSPFGSEAESDGSWVCFDAPCEWRRKLETVWESLLVPRTFDLCLAVDALWCEELCGADYPLTITDPRIAGWPLVLSSAGFGDLTGYTYHEVIGQQTFPFLLQGVPADSINVTARGELRKLLSAAARGIDYKCTSGPLLGEGLRSPAENKSEHRLQACAPKLREGEVVFLQRAAWKSGGPVNTIQYYKKIELDEKPYVVGLQAMLSDPGQDQCNAGIQKLKKRMACLERTLAARFWYCSSQQFVRH